MRNIFIPAALFAAMIATPAMAQQGPGSIEYGPGVIAPAQVNLQETNFYYPQNIPDPVQAAPCSAVPTLSFFGQYGAYSQGAGGLSLTIPLRGC